MRIRSEKSLASSRRTVKVTNEAGRDTQRTLYLPMNSSGSDPRVPIRGGSFPFVRCSHVYTVSPSCLSPRIRPPFIVYLSFPLSPRSCVPCSISLGQFKLVIPPATHQHLVPRVRQKPAARSSRRDVSAMHSDYGFFRGHP